MILNNETTNIREIKPLKRDALGTLDQFTKEYGPQMEYVIVLGVHKDGTTYLAKSISSHQEACFLKTFFDWWTTQWFDRHG